DVLISRRNDRRLRTGALSWVRKGARWTVTHVRRDGSLEVQREGRHGNAVVLPAEYVAAHVDLGYAVTAHRAQGLTVDTAHVVVSPSTTRENFYVSMTRGRQANTAYVALDKPDPLHAAPADPDATARRVLFGVLNHTGGELSARQTIEAEQARWAGIGQLAAEYETIATHAQRGRWTRLVTHALTTAGGLTPTETARAIESDAFAVLIAELRRAEANGHPVDTLLPRLVAQRSLLDADDVAAVVTRRLARTAARPARAANAGYIAGLVPAAHGPLPADAVQALTERRHLIETRARTIAEVAIRDHEPWVRYAGRPPTGGREREAWLDEIIVVAAYRDRYAITERTPLGLSVESLAQERDRRHAAAALQRAQKIERNT
ncbi:MAG: TrwC relaxase, partial [Actinomycetes bacterium]